MIEEVLMKKEPTGFVATCQCGEVVGVMDYSRMDRKDAGKILGKWLHAGCEIKPIFDNTFSVYVGGCKCIKT